MEIDRLLPGQKINSLRRRAKYLLFETDAGTAMLHLGMSGSVRIIDADEPAAKHDHVDVQLEIVLVHYCGPWIPMSMTSYVTLDQNRYRRNSMVTTCGKKRSGDASVLNNSS